MPPGELARTELPELDAPDKGVSILNEARVSSARSMGNAISDAIGRVIYDSCILDHLPVSFWVVARILMRRKS